MAAWSPDTIQTETLYRVGAVLKALDETGFHVARETVNRVSDTVLELETRSTRYFDRRWTLDQINQIITAFQIRESQGLKWDGVRRVLDGDAQDPEIADLRARYQALAEWASQLANEANQLAQDPTLGKFTTLPGTAA